jgi:isopenicillin N synthase-like dioxygenase
MLRIIRIGTSGDGAHIRRTLHDGFFLVRNPVPESAETYRALEEFFQLPTEEKSVCRVPGSNGQSGYKPPLIETAEKSTAPGWKELFHWEPPSPTPIRCAAGSPRDIRNRLCRAIWYRASVPLSPNCTNAGSSASSKW